MVADFNPHSAADMTTSASGNDEDAYDPKCVPHSSRDEDKVRAGEVVENCLGLVKAYNPMKGWGFVKTDRCDGQDCFLHKNNFASYTSFPISQVSPDMGIVVRFTLDWSGDKPKCMGVEFYCEGGKYLTAKSQSLAGAFANRNCAQCKSTMVWLVYKCTVCGWMDEHHSMVSKSIGGSDWRTSGKGFGKSRGSFNTPTIYASGSKNQASRDSRNSVDEDNKSDVGRRSDKSDDDRSDDDDEPSAKRRKLDQIDQQLNL